MKLLAIALILVSAANANAVEIDCSVGAFQKRSAAVTQLRSAAQSSTNLEHINSLIEKIDVLNAADRICMRANLLILDQELGK